MSGKLPIRVLMNDAIEASIAISPSFSELLKAEIEYNNLKPDVNYHHSKGNSINEIAQIDKDHRIHLYENFCQFLWCITYSMIVQFDWFNAKPDSLSIKVKHYDRAVKLFDEAFLLLIPKHEAGAFLELPNPEVYETDEEEYIKGVNEVFNYSITYILLHEFAHQFYGHIDTESNSSKEFKEDERKADKYAIDTMLKDGRQENRYLYELGIVFAMIGMILLKNTFDGGNMHPNQDERLITALNEMESEDTWGYAAMSLILWNMRHRLNIEILPVDGSYKDLFNSTIKKINFSMSY